MTKSAGFLGALALAALVAGCATAQPLTAEQRLQCETMLGGMSSNAAQAGSAKTPGPTGLCRPPFQILAISFKGDAAGNLADRVKQRCPAEFSDRFTSITFDAFTKNLVDRFHTAIPAEWRPTKPYEIAFWDYKSTNYWLTRARLAAPEPWKAEIEEIGPSSFEGRTVGARRMLVPHATMRSSSSRRRRRWTPNSARRWPRAACAFATKARWSAKSRFRTCCQTASAGSSSLR